MTKELFIRTFAAALMFFGSMSAAAQVSNPQTCRGPIYTRKEVNKPAKLIDQPNFKALYEAFGNNVSARVTLAAVLCRSGRITDIHVIDSQPPTFGEFVAAAVSLLRFKPAELNWHTVSQRQQLEFNINGYGVSGIDSGAAAGRRIEELDIIGNRRMTKEQILAWIKTRPGEIYSADQVQKDLMAILATENFNALGTRVTLEDGVRGGVRVIFKVVELPLIVDVRFDGLKEADRSAIIEEFRNQHVDVQKGTPLDSAKLKQAERVIESFLESKGWRDVKAATFVENLKAGESVVTFRVTAYKFGS